MKPRELARLRELCQDATPGPWEAHVAIRFKGIEQERGVLGPNGENVVCWVVDEFEQSTNNDAFIAVARTALPQLLDEIERLQNHLSPPVPAFKNPPKPSVCRKVAGDCSCNDCPPENTP